jgi:ADP-ribosylglycohydrolase
MHDVLDDRDLIPDEAEQLLHSGYPVERELVEARAAAAASDLPRLRQIGNVLRAAVRGPWPYDEPDDEELLVEVATRGRRLPVVEASLHSQIHGAWLGRCVANTMGKPVEGLRRDEVGLYLTAAGQSPQTGYLPLIEPLPDGVSHLHESAPFATAGRFVDVPRDDDLDWTILGLAMLEEHGPDLTTEDIARTWLDRLPFTQTFTAERIAYRNLIRGASVSQAARLDNPYREWIGALIRADIFGYVHPGDPAAAACASLVDARLSHVGNGIYGEMWAAALVASALASDSPEAALRSALPVVPDKSRLAEALRSILQLRADGVGPQQAIAWVDEHLGHYNWVHTINNAALISIGLLWGTDFTSAVALTISGGRDTDSSAATVGSVFGAIYGADAIPSSLVGTTHVRVRSAVKDFDRIEIAELARRTLSLIGGS